MRICKSLRIAFISQGSYNSLKMKILIFFYTLFFVIGPDLATVREKYIAAQSSQDGADVLYTMLKDIPDDNANTTLVAYKAAALILKARHEKVLSKKKQLFIKGAKLMEAVIAANANNYEPRLLRLGIQENAPGITRYKSDIDDDKAFLIQNFSTQKNDLKKYTRDFIKVSGLFTKQEKSGFM